MGTRPPTTTNQSAPEFTRPRKMVDLSDHYRAAARNAASEYHDAVDDLALVTASALDTGDWSGYRTVFERLQDAAWNAVQCRRHIERAFWVNR